MSLKYIKIEQLLASNWYNIVNIDVEEGGDDQIAVTISKLAKGLAESGSLHITKNNGDAAVITASCGPVKMSIGEE